MYTVCLVEDNADSRELFADWLRSCKRLQLLGAYSTGEEALREVPQVNPDAILMDIKLPGISGIDCVIALQQLIPSCNASVLMLTGHEDGNLIFEALQAGAQGYLLKRHASAREFEAAIVEVMAGGRPFDRMVAQTVTRFFQTSPTSDGRDAFHPRPQCFGKNGTQWNASLPGSGIQSHALGLAALTPCELKVLKFVALGLTYKEVADGLKISVATVGKHVQSIFHKLGIRSRTDPRLYSAANSLGQNRLWRQASRPT